MLEFIAGRAGSGKTSLCLGAVKEKLMKEPQGTPLIILLPDHMTFAVERHLALLTKEYGGFSRAYVLGIKRLAYQVLLRCGGALHPHLSDIGRQLLLSRVLSGAKLSVLAKAARQYHFTSAVSKIIEELKTAGISAGQLEDLAKSAQAKDETLRQKLADLAAIYKGLDEQMKGRYHDSEDILSLAASRIEGCAWLAGAEIWIDGFDAFSPQHLTIIEKLMKTARDIHLTLCIDNVHSSEHEAQTALFHRQYVAFRQIRDIARRIGMPVKICELKESRRYNNETLRFIERHMFKFPLESSGCRTGVQIVETPNRRLECEAVAADIVRLCREEGFRYYDIGILMRGEDEYGDLMQAVLKDYDILFFSDKKRQTAHHPLAELIRSSIESLRTWRYEPLFRMFKTDFFEPDREDIDCLENYVLSFGIRGYTRWSQDEDWRFHEGGLEDDAADAALEEKLSGINSIRRRLMPPLAGFYKDMKKAETAEEHIKALYDFLARLNVPDTLTKWSAAAQECGDAALAKEHRQIWNNIVELMEQIVQTCGGDYISLKDFEQLISDGLDGIQTALIPPGYDYVTLASFEHNTLNNKRAVYIIGANEKLMPRRSRNEGMLSDADRLFMIGQGLTISSGALEDNFAERYLLYKGFTLATDYLWVSYALADPEGNGQSRSVLVGRLRQILPQAEFASVSLENTERAMLISSKRRSLSGVASALRGLKEQRGWERYWQDVYNYLLNLDTKDGADLPFRAAVSGVFAQAPQAEILPALAEKLYMKRRLLRGSVTRFEQFFSCPFRHFARYALNLQERKEFNFAAPDLGVLLHAVMYRFGKYLAEHNRSWQSVTEQECGKICKDIIDRLAPRMQNQILLSSSRYKHLLERIRRLAAASLLRLIEFSKHSSFKPRAFEQSFGLNSDMQPLLLDDESGHKIEITGQIDRIDSADNYYLVIDYKSGSAFINLLEVYYGLKLQLLTYLLVAKNAAAGAYGMKDAVPAGILYCFLKTPRITSKVKLSESELKNEIEKQMRMPGWVLAQPDVIRKIDDSLHFIKVRLNKDDSIASSSKAYVKTPEEFDALMQRVESELKDAGRRILNGEAGVRPYKIKDASACSYCPYLAVCRFDKSIEGYAYNEIEERSDEEIMLLLQSGDKEDNAPKTKKPKGEE